MAIIKFPKKDARCEKCNSPVEIFIPADRIGNVWGEEWDCPKCGKDIEKIITTIITR